MSWLIIDLETENHEYLGQKAPPYCPDNYIVAPGWAFNDGPVQHLYFNNRAEAEAEDWLAPLLEKTTVLVAHNAGFELEWFLHRHRDALFAFLKRGGRVFCTQYAEYLLSHQTELYPTLEDTATKYGGTKKIDQVKLLWEQGYLTSQIDRELLVEYLAGPSGDIENTRRAAFAQYALLEQQGMLEMFWLRMDALIFNSVCSHFGLHVNMETAHKNHAEQLARADELRADLQKLLPADMPAELEFSFGSRYHLSAFLFGGPIKYKARVPYDPPQYEKADAYELKYPCAAGEEAANTVYKFPQDVKPEELMYVTVYASGKNKGQPKSFKMPTDVEKLKWGDKVYTFKPLIDLGDLPTHVSEEYTGKRAQFRGKQTLCDGVTPIYSTGKDSLDILANFSGAAKPLKELAQLDKDNGTYYIAHDYNKDGSIKKSTGMLTCVGPDGIIHHRLNNCATVTTRLSSSDPNLQNLPREGTSKVKEMFDSRFPDGYVTEVDYTSLEVVDIAAASGDKNLLEKILNGTDMHLYRLAGARNSWQGMDYDQLCAINDDKKHNLYKAVHEARTAIKPKAFSAQYGATAMGISFSTGCSLEEAQEFLENEAALFPESTNFRYVIKAEVERTGSEPSALCREVDDYGNWSIYRRGYYRAPGGTCYSFRQYKQRVDRKEVLDYKITQLANYPIQGESAFIVQVACGRLLRAMLATDCIQNGYVLPINTVHDAVYQDCINEEWAIWAAKLAKSVLETTPAFIAERIPAYREWNYHTTPFPAVPEYGKNLMSKEHIHE